MALLSALLVFSLPGAAWAANLPTTGRPSGTLPGAVPGAAGSSSPADLSLGGLSPGLETSAPASLVPTPSELPAPVPALPGAIQPALGAPAVLPAPSAIEAPAGPALPAGPAAPPAQAGIPGAVLGPASPPTQNAPAAEGPRLLFTKQFAQALGGLGFGGQIPAWMGASLDRSLSWLFDRAVAAPAEPDIIRLRLPRNNLSVFLARDRGTNTALFLDARLRRDIPRRGKRDYLKRLKERARSAEKHLVGEDEAAALRARITSQPPRWSAKSSRRGAALPVRRSAVSTGYVDEAAPWPAPEVRFTRSFSGSNWTRTEWLRLKILLDRMLARGPSGASPDTVWEFSWRSGGAYFHFDEQARVVTLLEVRPKSSGRAKNVVETWRPRFAALDSELAEPAEQERLSALLGPVAAPPRPLAPPSALAGAPVRQAPFHRRARRVPKAEEPAPDPRVAFTVDFVESVRNLAAQREGPRWGRSQWAHLRADLLNLFDGKIVSSILAKRGPARAAGVKKFKWGGFRIFFLIEPGSGKVIFLDVKAKDDIVAFGEGAYYEELARRAAEVGDRLAGPSASGVLLTRLGPLPPRT